jgi:hypothetical protein
MESVSSRSPRPAEDKLDTLRRLDTSRPWDSLDDQRYCIGCKRIISGRQIEVIGGSNGLRALRLKCPTDNCQSAPDDWILPRDSSAPDGEIDFLFRDNGG